MAPSRKRVFHFELWPDPAGKELLESRPDFEVRHLSPNEPEDKNWEIVRGGHAYMVGARRQLRPTWYPDEKLIAASPNLLTICNKGTGVEAIDLDACTRAGVIVCNQRGANADAVAEYTLALMMALARKIVQAERIVKKGVPSDYRVILRGPDLRGKTVGVVGMGLIGARVAELCRAVGMTVLVNSAHASEADLKAQGARKADLTTILREADFITLHGLGSDGTSRKLGADELAAMKPTALLINTARPDLIDEAALIEAIATRRIAGFAADVLVQEPTPKDHPLLAFDNVIITPHVAGVSDGALVGVSLYIAEQFIQILNGEIPPRLLNHAAWPAYQDRFERVMGFRPPNLPPKP